LVPGIDVKIGLGLWNSIVASVLLELSILLIGGWIYFRSSISGADPVGKYGMSIFMIVLVIFTILTPFQSFPDILAVAAMGGFLIVLFALAAFWLDSKKNAIG
jgi:hypothetical protein